MGRTFRVYLAGESVFCCRQCNAHIAVSESVISKVSSNSVYEQDLADFQAFNGQHGRAVLIHHASAPLELP